MTGSPVVVLSLVLNDRGPRRYVLEIEPLLEPPIDRADSLRLTDAIAERLSQLVARHPDQWFVFQPEWSAPSTQPEAD